MTRPREMEAYLQHYGWHFSKRAVEYAASMMWNEDGEPGKKKRINPYNREALDELMKKHNITLEYDVLYDAVYVATMCKADFMYGDAAIEDELHMLRYVKGVIDDPDADEGEVFATWVMRMKAKGEPIDWEKML